MRFRAIRVKATGEWLAVMQQTTGQEFGDGNNSFMRDVLASYPDLTMADVEVVVDSTDPRVPPFREPQASAPPAVPDHVQAIREARAGVDSAGFTPPQREIVNKLITAAEHFIGDS